MLCSCAYCGKIHEKKYICQQKEKATKDRFSKRKSTIALAFRRTNAWKKKSVDIRKRDNYLCLCCKANLLGTVVRLNTNDLSVHHIVPIEEDYDRRLDDDNLITVCDIHHELCEANKITRSQQKELIPPPNK